MKTKIKNQAHRRFTRALGGMIALATVSTALAVPVVEESFPIGPYTLGTLFTQNPTSTGFFGAWTEAYPGAASPTVVAPNLTYSDGTRNMTTSGGSIRLNGDFGRGGRLLDVPYDDTTAGVVYFAFLMRLDNVQIGTYRGLELHSGGFDDGANRIVQIVTGEGNVANPIDNSRFTVRLNNTDLIGGDLGLANTNVNLFVCKFTFSADPVADQLEIWRNPTNIGNEVSSGAATYTSPLTDLKIDRASVARFTNNAGGGFTLDEIRFGTTWTDVTSFDPSDNDNDGLPNAWENLYGLNPNENGTVGETTPGAKNGPNGALGNPDNDGLTNLQEFSTYFTNPVLADTDADGINDGPEITLGTSPTNPDTDGDTLNDGAEGPLGTNPLLADTDLDGENDGVEVRQGTSPTNAPSNSATATFVVYDGFATPGTYTDGISIGGISGGTGWTGPWAGDFNGAIPGLSSGSLLTTSGQATIQNNGGNFSICARPITSQGTGELWVSWLYSPGNPDSNYSGFGITRASGGEVSYIGTDGNGQLRIDTAAAGGTNNTYGPLIGGTTLFIAVKIDFLNNTLTVYVNPTPGGALNAPVATFTGLTGLSPINQVLFLGAGNGATTFDEIRIGKSYANVAPLEFNVRIVSTQLINSNTQLQLQVVGLTIGADYRLQESTTLSSFTDVPGSTFIAGATTATLNQTVNPGAVPKKFFRVVDIP